MGRSASSSVVSALSRGTGSSKPAASVDGVTAPLNRVRTDKGKLRVVIASQLRRSILVFRNLEEAANLFQGHYQQQLHPVPLLYSPSEHAIRLLVAH